MKLRLKREQNLTPHFPCLEVERVILMEKKSRPKDPEKLIEAVKTHKLDNRTRQAREMEHIKKGLTEQPGNTAKALLKNQVAQNIVIAKEIFNYAMNSGELVDSQGELNGLIKKHLLRFQGAAKTALVELLKLEGNTAASNTEVEDIFNDVFDE